MAYRVEIPLELWGPFRKLPREVASRLYGRLEEIAQLAEECPPLNPLWLKRGVTDAPLLRCVVEGWVLLYEVDEARRTVSVLDVEPEEEAEGWLGGAEVLPRH
jgi:mRNA-degrading endonuclease RelE of RelBE toxin-antitoxin system